MNTYEDFLKAYAEYLEWEDTDPVVIMRKLCEEYFYTPVTGREFLMMALGWMWGKSNDYVAANCYCGLLKIKIDEVYVVIAKENDWD